MKHLSVNKLLKGLFSIYVIAYICAMTQEILSESIIKFAATRSDEAVMNPKSGYYPFNIIAEAFEEGFKKGEDAFKEKLREQFFLNAKLVNEAISSLFKKLEKSKIPPKKIFIDISINGAKILVSIDEATYISDDFIDEFYSNVSDIKSEFYDKGLNLDLGFLNNKKDTNNILLDCDGYNMGFDLGKKTRLY